jgi:hypothetical protein
MRLCVSVRVRGYALMAQHRLAVVALQAKSVRMVMVAVMCAARIYMCVAVSSWMLLLLLLLLLIMMNEPQRDRGVVAVAVVVAVVVDIVDAAVVIT